ncbi:MAG: choice-of-anchor V domain-containing protein [Chitinophagaceae bacterium]
MKKLFTLSFIALGMIALQSSVNFSSVPPTGYTGASGDYCNSCHSSFALNSGGGGVSISGLPTSNYVPNQQYTFSLTINHGTADRRRWGFSIAAVNGNGNSVGSFSSANSNAATNGTELSHNNAVSTGDANTYTYNNLRWTAPATANQAVTFYYVGNAGNAAGGSSGDYIYSGTSAIALPITLASFDAIVKGETVGLRWKTSNEINGDYFLIEKSDNGQHFYNIGKVIANGNTTTTSSYSFTDAKPSFFERDIFYRLQLVDKDGTRKLSNTVKVRLAATETQLIKVYPTITTRNSTVIADIKTERNRTIDIQFIDNTGKVLATQQHALVSGSNTIKVAMPNNAATGVIFATFSSGNWKQTIRLLIL